jgi:methylmalonyl-CoA mutase N-terminal domain/subunit
VKATRDGEAVASALASVAKAATGTTPLVPPIVEAVRARATLGEISDALRQVWGVYRASA